MSEPTLVKPDREFTKRVIEAGGEDLKKCYQCATCSVVCELSPDKRPFPRKELIWAQWGLKDRLVADPDIWLCYRCNDCSTRCPRKAKPGDVLAALRQQTIRHYAVPGILSSWMGQPKFWPVLLAIPAVLLGLALLLKGPIEKVLGFLSEPGGHEGWRYGDLFPHGTLIGFFTFFSILAGLVAIIGIVRFWKTMKAADARAGGGGSPALGLVPSFVRAVKELLLHARFGKCLPNGSRAIAHMGVLYGFLALFIVTVWAVIVLYFFNRLLGMDLVYPFTFWNPMKLLGNLGALALIAGCLLMIRDRLKRDDDKAGTSSMFDWWLVGILLAVAVTGLITELFRFGNLRLPGFVIYFIHLDFVFALLIYLPYSKFAHLIYRTVALVYAEHAGRK